MKKCKPNYKMNKFQGCDLVKPIFKYGSCQSCFIKWTQTTEDGKEWLKKQTAHRYRKNKEQEEKEKRAETRRKKDELNSYRAMQQADTYFSRYIRLKHSENGFCTCYTCGDIKVIKESENGHWQKRKEKATRYHENNCRPQCKTCNGNTAKNGMQLEFRSNLVREIGEDEVQEIERLAKTTIKADSYFYRAIATKYRKLVNDLQKELGVKYW